MPVPWEFEEAVCPEDKIPAASSRLSLTEDGDAETVAGETEEMDNDNVSILSRMSYPDSLGRKDLLVPSNEPSKIVYEAWEVVKGEDAMVGASRTICGIKIGVKWESLGNGFTELNPQNGYGQKELADLHRDAIQEYEARGPKNRKPYAQDLANRVSGLKAEVYDKIQLLVEDKIKATNGTPFRRREWRIVVLEEGEFQMTELFPERKKGIFRKHRQAPAVRRFFIVLRGEEVKITKEKEGWGQFTRHTNPWCRVDMQETREARRDHRGHLEKMGRILEARRSSVIRNEMKAERIIN
ncbi:uncharacterized protein GGS22DRAFT_105754 [Annulohypoxylon maeteangense]|uniref:uncharacterized protein n=1 Tax=Annulohypoxylon maeteangense TaxID=1927788 RepID=UPI002007D239|nr:uncharacterized protein GGS22DRAFT_105754 [Annulohypoxylon maeteangense]KAI0887172.1 hypothetical protein GGS22DRAFT_105754 [Annulohypoxylon maeteangense]